MPGRSRCPTPGGGAVVPESCAAGVEGGRWWSCTEPPGPGEDRSWVSRPCGAQVTQRVRGGAVPAPPAPHPMLSAHEPFPRHHRSRSRRRASSDPSGSCRNRLELKVLVAVPGVCPRSRRRPRCPPLASVARSTVLWPERTGVPASAGEGAVGGVCGAPGPLAQARLGPGRGPVRRRGRLAVGPRAGALGRPPAADAGPRRAVGPRAGPLGRPSAADAGPRRAVGPRSGLLGRPPAADAIPRRAVGPRALRSFERGKAGGLAGGRAAGPGVGRAAGRGTARAAGGGIARTAGRGTGRALAARSRRTSSAVRSRQPPRGSDPIRSGPYAERWSALTVSPTASHMRRTCR